MKIYMVVEGVNGYSDCDAKIKGHYTLFEKANEAVIRKMESITLLYKECVEADDGEILNYLNLKIENVKHSWFWENITMWGNHWHSLTILEIECV